MVYSQGCENLNITREPGRCIWFGTCADYPIYVSDGRLPCFDNGLARNISSLGDDFMSLLEDACPQYLEGGTVCCGHDQLLSLATQIKYPKQLFARCPACLNNFIDHFCATTCDPDQSLFMNPTTCLPGRTDKNVSNLAVQNIDIYLTEEYADDLYSSCDQVQYPQASNRVVDIMCGGTDTCNSTLWLNYLADPNQNHNSPFPFVYKINTTEEDIPEDVYPRTYNFTPCNTNDTQLRCSCADCDTTDLCPAPPQAPKYHFPEKIVFDSVVGIGVCLSMIMFALAMVFGAVITFRHLSSSGYGSLEGDEDSPTSSVGSVNADEVIRLPRNTKLSPFAAACMPFYIIGAHLENWIKTVFYHWGRFVTQFWPIVMGVGIGLVSIIVLLTVTLHVTNVLPFVITTNPVELWSAPSSRARQEKNYFDEHFGPFYRTEMLIFTSDGEGFTFQPQGVYGVSNWTFGPVMTNDVLLEVWDIIWSILPCLTNLC
jgi:Niemann-Pick C1 protein